MKKVKNHTRPPTIDEVVEEFKQAFGSTESISQLGEECKDAVFEKIVNNEFAESTISDIKEMLGAERFDMFLAEQKRKMGITT